MKERDNEGKGRGKKEQNEEAAKRSAERRLTRCVWAALPASIRRHLKCVHVRSRTRTHIRIQGNVAQIVHCTSCSPRWPFVATTKATAQKTDKKRPIELAKCLWIATINGYRAKIVLCFHLGWSKHLLSFAR